LVICMLTVVGCGAEMTEGDFTQAREVLWEEVLSKDGIAYEDVFFEEEEIKRLPIGDGISAYSVQIRVATDDVNTYTYGYYAVSEGDIYEYEFATDVWNPVE